MAQIEASAIDQVFDEGQETAGALFSSVGSAYSATSQELSHLALLVNQIPTFNIEIIDFFRDFAQYLSVISVSFAWSGIFTAIWDRLSIFVTFSINLLRGVGVRELYPVLLFVSLVLVLVFFLQVRWLPDIEQDGLHYVDASVRRLPWLPELVMFVLMTLYLPTTQYTLELFVCSGLWEKAFGQCYGALHIVYIFPALLVLILVSLWFPWKIGGLVQENRPAERPFDAQGRSLTATGIERAYKEDVENMPYSPFKFLLLPYRRTWASYKSRVMWFKLVLIVPSILLADNYFVMSLEDQDASTFQVTSLVQASVLCALLVLYYVFALATTVFLRPTDDLMDAIVRLATALSAMIGLVLTVLSVVGILSAVNALGIVVLLMQLISVLAMVLLTLLTLPTVHRAIQTTGRCLLLTLNSTFRMPYVFSADYDPDQALRDFVWVHFWDSLLLSDPDFGPPPGKVLLFHDTDFAGCTLLNFAGTPGERLLELKRVAADQGLASIRKAMLEGSTAKTHWRTRLWQELNGLDVMYAPVSGALGTLFVSADGEPVRIVGGASKYGLVGAVESDSEPDLLANLDPEHGNASAGPASAEREPRRTGAPTSLISEIFQSRQARKARAQPTSADVVQSRATEDGLRLCEVAFPTERPIQRLQREQVLTDHGEADHPRSRTCFGVLRIIPFPFLPYLVPDHFAKDEDIIQVLDREHATSCGIVHEWQWLLLLNGHSVVQERIARRDMLRSLAAIEEVPFGFSKTCRRHVGSGDDRRTVEVELRFNTCQVKIIPRRSTGFHEFPLSLCGEQGSDMRRLDMNPGFTLQLEYCDGQGEADGKEFSGERETLLADDLRLDEQTMALLPVPGESMLQTPSDRDGKHPLQRLLDESADIGQGGRISIRRKRAYRKHMYDTHYMRKQSVMRDEFWYFVYNQVVPRDRLERYLCEYEVSWQLEQLPERHRAGLDFLYARVDRFKRNPVELYWYVVWHDLYVQNATLQVIIDNRELLDPAIPSSLCYKHTLTRSELEQVLMNATPALYTLGRAKSSWVSPVLLDNLFHNMERVRKGEMPELLGRTASWFYLRFLTV